MQGEIISCYLQGCKHVLGESLAASMKMYASQINIKTSFVQMHTI